MVNIILQALTSIEKTKTIQTRGHAPNHKSFVKKLQDWRPVFESSLAYSHRHILTAPEAGDTEENYKNDKLLFKGIKETLNKEQEHLTNFELLAILRTDVKRIKTRGQAPNHKSMVTAFKKCQLLSKDPNIFALNHESNDCETNYLLDRRALARAVGHLEQQVIQHAVSTLCLQLIDMLANVKCIQTRKQAPNHKSLVDTFKSCRNKIAAFLEVPQMAALENQAAVLAQTNALEKLFELPTKPTKTEDNYRIDRQLLTQTKKSLMKKAGKESWK